MKYNPREYVTLGVIRSRLSAAGAQTVVHKLEHAILPLYYAKPDAYTEIRRSTIALNGSFFHTQRMVLQYVRNAYLGVEP